MFNFLQYKKYVITLSIILVIAGIYGIVRFGFNYSIEFVGGSNIEYQFDKEVSREKVEEIITAQDIEPTELNVENQLLSLRAPPIDENKEASLQATLRSELDTELTILRSETVGPTVSADLVTKTMIALTIGMFVIFGYITFAFKDFRYALSAIVALFHDVFILLGSYAFLSHFLGAELDTLFVTAALTTMSLSVHDTIVMFDKIREHSRREGTSDMDYVANRALTETLVRSLNSSLTTTFMLLALVLLGGDTIRFFAISLLIGVIVGTYSSPFVAVPLLVWLEKRRTK